MRLNSGTRLTIANLSAGYGKREIFSNLSLPPLLPGRVIALVGPNAAGKSTLLRAMAQLIGARGKMHLGAMDLMQLRPAARAATIGFMPQNLPDDVGLSVLEALMAAMRATGSAGATSAGLTLEERAFGLLDGLGVSYFASSRLDMLSGGQKQVASLALAIASQPSILLLDEPTSALDPARQYFVMQMVKDYAAAGRIVIAVFHDLALASQWADEIVILTDGKLHSSGPPDEVLTPKMLAEIYEIRARVERCSKGMLQILVDNVMPRTPSSPRTPSNM